MRFDFQFKNIFSLEFNLSIRIGKDINSDFPLSSDLLPRALKFKFYFKSILFL